MYREGFGKGAEICPDFLRISGVADETSRRGRVSAGQGRGNTILGCIA
ncbi:MAG: hypothetical protein MPL62_01405 [Alphaproteobacteria bacterium]|nr:hypothetical protein [Alphaproteobacteria bacterium]